ncbi:MAG: hypothetical protein AAFU67_06460 [Bacteroidota bacterium]
MPVITCALDGILNDNTCNKSKGVKAVYWVERTSINWDGMLADSNCFDQVNQQILAYKMLGGATFSQIEFQRRTAQFDATYTSDTGAYDILLQMIIEGKSCARRNALNAAIKCCDIYLHVYLNNGDERVIGIEWDGEAFDAPLTLLAITRHLDSYGVFDGDDPRDELDIGGSQFTTPLCASVSRTALPLPPTTTNIEVYGDQAGGTDAFGPTGGGTDAYGTQNATITQ